MTKTLRVIVCLGLMVVTGSIAMADTTVIFWVPSDSTSSYHAYGARISGGDTIYECHLPPAGVLRPGQSKTFRVPNGVTLYIKFLENPDPCVRGRYSFYVDGKPRGGTYRYQIGDHRW